MRKECNTIASCIFFIIKLKNIEHPVSDELFINLEISAPHNDINLTKVPSVHYLKEIQISLQKIYILKLTKAYLFRLSLPIAISMCRRLDVHQKFI